MAKKVKETANEINNTNDLLNIINGFSENAEIIESSYYSNIKDWIPSGNYILNACMSGDLFKAYPGGRIITLAGPSGCGKSYLAISACREAQKLGYNVIYLDSEGAIDSVFVKRLGCDPNKFIIKQVSTISEVSNFVANLCKTFETKGIKEPKVILVLDSLGNLTSDKELNDTLTANNVRDMSKQQNIRAMFRVNATPIAKLGIPWIVVSHTYEKVGSYIPGAVVSGGGGLAYNASITLMLSTAKLEDKNNDKAATEKKGEFTKNGVLVTARPEKSRFCIPQKVKFQIPFFCKPNPYVGLEQYLTWDNSKICRGNKLEEKEYLKLTPAEQLKCVKFEDGDFSCWVQPKDTARNMFIGHLHDTVPILEFFTDKVFTPEFLKYINENVIKPAFELPDQSSFEDIKELEDSMGIQMSDSDEMNSEQED